MKVEDATVHGLRYRDWAGNVSKFPREVTETALAHVIGDKAEQAYRRSDALETRRKLMEAWAANCVPKAPLTLYNCADRGDSERRPPWAAILRVHLPFCPISHYLALVFDNVS
jgi:hypothetical protein